MTPPGGSGAGTPGAGATAARANHRSGAGPTLQRAGTALRHELRLLRRYGILGAAVLTTLVWAVLLRLLPEPARPVALELVAFTQLAVVGYTFAGALVLLEKAERSTLAIAVTPLRTAERVLARVTALTGVALAATAVVVLTAAVPLPGTPLPGTSLLLGVAGTSAVALLASLAVVASHTSVAQWALPSVGPLVVLALPLLGYAGVSSPLLWLLPTQGGLVLLRGPGSVREAVVAWATTVAWTGALGVVATRRHARWVATADA
jgi:fluoroquinolone transport system permease protein